MKTPEEKIEGCVPSIMTIYKGFVSEGFDPLAYPLLDIAIDLYKHNTTLPSSPGAYVDPPQTRKEIL